MIWINSRASLQPKPTTPRIRFHERSWASSTSGLKLFLLVHGDDIAELPQDSWNHLFAGLAKGIQGSLFKIGDKLQEDKPKLRTVKIEHTAMTQLTGLP